PEIRLANGPSRCQGRVEILYNGSWGTVCDDDWDIVDANVVCRQLGCGHAVALPAPVTFGQGRGPIFLDNVDCKGREAALSECWSHGWGIHNCYHYEDVAVICSELSPTPASEGPTSRTVTASVQRGESDGSIRLVSGPDGCQGRVEIFYRGSWGTVCDDDWGLSDASVVCRQGSPHIPSLPHAARDHLPPHPSGIPRGSPCIPWAHPASLGLTPHPQVTPRSQGIPSPPRATPGVPPRSPRSHRGGTRAGLDAAGPVPVPVSVPCVPCRGPPAGGGVRLANGNGSCRGRVEVRHGGAWGTVCDDDWGLSDASVVCRQVGCGQALDYKSNAYFGYGTGRILLDNVNCEGSEPFLAACYSLGWGIHNCGHHEDAGVVCRDPVGSSSPGEQRGGPEGPLPSAAPSAGFLRLVNGSHRCEGRVELFYLSQWGTVCDDAWDLRDAGVVCRQLGCGRAVAAWGEARYGQGAGYIFLDNLKCKGDEASLLRCSHIRWDVHNCDHSEDAGALCSLL
ncbi:SRB4D protein, partial [Eudromia elegans]|nr:SRB4D protein [Eudromia elegans]